MTMGHLATALVPHSRLRDAPLWLLLLCAQLPDFLWLVLALAGLEAPAPTNFLDVTIVGLRTDLIYSHSGAGVALTALVTAGIVYAVWRRADLSAWCAALVVLHWLEDLVCGWKHELLARGSPRVGLDLYTRGPYLAFAIEGVFAAALVAWYVRSEARQGRGLAAGKQVALYAAFVGGSLMFAGTSYYSFRTLLGLGA
jgi:hypothetical protein